jgi:hypothetical protein
MRNLITHVLYRKETDFLLHNCTCLLHVQDVQDAQGKLKHYQKIEVSAVKCIVI